MAIVSNDSVQHLTVLMEVEDEECSIGFWYGTADVAPAGSSLQIINRFRAQCEPALLAVLAENTAIVGYSCYGYIPGNATVEQLPIGRVFGGSGETDPLPANVAAHYYFRQQDISQRSFRHLYVPGLPEVWYSSGTWDFATYSTEFTNLGEALLEPLSGGGLAYNALPCLKHRVGAPPGPFTYEFYTLATWSLTKRAGHIRRRSIYQTRAFGTGTPSDVGAIVAGPPLVPVVGWGGP